VLVVSRDPDWNLLNAVPDAGSYDIVFIESTGRAYSQIKHTAPDLVILCLSIGETEGLQVLSMLKLDDETACIPVITCVAPDPVSCEGDSDDSFDYVPREIVAVGLN
jgi:CheY-like chemotaxis protein